MAHSPADCALQFAAWLSAHPAVGIRSMLGLTRLPSPTVQIHRGDNLTEWGYAVFWPLTAAECRHQLHCVLAIAQARFVVRRHVSQASKHRRCLISSLATLRGSAALALGSSARPSCDARPASMHAIEVYAPRFYSRAAALDATSGTTGKLIRGLLIEEESACGEDEDVVSLALTAVHRLMTRHNVHPRQIGRVAVSSNSIVDRSKSIKTEVMALLEVGGADVEGTDHTGGPDLGADALQSCASWVEGSAWDGRCSVAIFVSNEGALAVLVGKGALLSSGSARHLARVHVAGVHEGGLQLASEQRNALESMRSPLWQPASHLGRGPKAGGWSDVLATLTSDSNVLSRLDGRVPLVPTMFEVLRTCAACKAGRHGWRPATACGVRPSAAFYVQEVQLGATDGTAYRCYAFEDVVEVPFYVQENATVAHHASPPAHVAVGGAAPSGGGVSPLAVLQMLGSLGGGCVTAPAAAAAAPCVLETSAVMREVASELVAGVSADAPLMEAGLDSLGVVEFRNRLASRLGDGIELPDTLLFDFPTLAQLDAHLSAQARSLAPAAPAVASGAGSGGGVSPLAVLQMLGSLGGGCVTAPAAAAAAPCVLETSALLREVASELVAGVSADAPLMEAGLDSLGVVEFRNRLASRLGDGIELPDTLLFDFPTLAQLDAHLSAQARSLAPAAPAVASGAGSGGGVSPLAVLQMLGSLGGGCVTAPAAAAAAPCVLETSALLREVASELVAGVSADAPLMEAGLDSLGVVEFRNRLASRLGDGIELPDTLLFDFPTLAQLDAHLSAQARSLAPAAPAVASGAGSGGGVSPLAVLQMLGSLGPPTTVETATVHRSAACVWGASALLPSGPLSTGVELSAGADGVAEVPLSRWDVAAQPSLPEPIASRVRHGGFVSGAHLVDNGAFSVPPAEAAAMDPQQRLLLEHGYAALHDASLDRVALNGSLTGFFLGIASTDFAQVLPFTPAGSSVYAATGSTLSIASGRVSYVLGLHGPCASYDTACSAALTAGHAGLRAMQMNECNVALVAGVTLMLTPGAGTSFGIAGMTSASGRCHTFDVRANGYARGEACGALALQHSAADAPLDMLGSAVRQDGRSASLTAPNGQAQQGLIVAALADGATAADALTLSEAHGTGTALGDPIEAGSLAGALLASRGADLAPLSVGGVKANIGHAEPAAGMTGLLRLVVGLSSGMAAPNAQLRVLNPHLRGAMVGTGCALATHVGALGELQSRVGSVSSFGYSGTIAHAVTQGRSTAPVHPLCL